MVTIKVGPQKMPFVAHKGLLCSLSPFFAAALRGSFQESSTQSVHLAEDDPEIFDIIHVWLYTNQITVPSRGNDVAPHGLKLLDAYVLADKLNITRACDASIDLFSVAAIKFEIISSNLLALIYERTRPNDRLRQLMIAMILQNYQYNIEEITLRNPEVWSGCPSLLMDLLLGMKDKCATPPRGLHPLSLCDYHCHRADEQCSQSGKTYRYTMVRLVVLDKPVA